MTSASTKSSRGGGVKEYRCEITGNPVGTDTWAVRADGSFDSCRCRTCQWWVEMRKVCVCGHDQGIHAAHWMSCCGINTCRCNNYQAAS